MEFWFIWGILWNCEGYNGILGFLLVGIAVSPDRTHMALSHSGYGEECPIISVYKIYNVF
jgi:hypothetical protein